MDFHGSSPYPEGVISFLDTDLYKLTMQCAVLKYYPEVQVKYSFINRTPDMKLTRGAFKWLENQIQKLGNISLSADELRYLQTTCTYLSAPYLEFLRDFRLRPREQVSASFAADAASDSGSDADAGAVAIEVRGRWVDTILYEIPLLALTSEAYFRFVDTDWSYAGQEERAYAKGMRLLRAGCAATEFGTRRRRDYHTQALVFRGLARARREAEEEEEEGGVAEAATKTLPGRIVGTSNVHLAMRFGIPPVGTVAHEWFMGVAAITDDYEHATETALARWVGCFGEGVLGVALTDTLGTPAFLRAFARPMPDDPSCGRTGNAPRHGGAAGPPAARTGDGATRNRTFAEVFTGVRQDSGDPAAFVALMAAFYAAQGIDARTKTVVFSDSLNVELCERYRAVAAAAGFGHSSFGVGTFLTNDFRRLSDGAKSVPLNIVIKLSEAAGHKAVKLSDTGGKNTGDRGTVESVKERVGYTEDVEEGKGWQGADESTRWGKAGDRDDD